MSFNTATPYIASYVLFRKGDQVLFLMRSNTGWRDGFYGLPSGKVEKGESYIEAAIREIKEEVGVDILQDDLKYVLTSHRLEDGTDWVDIVFEALKWNGEPYNAEPKVHGEIKWLDLKHLPKNIVPSVKYMLEKMLAGKNYCEYGWVQ